MIMAHRPVLKVDIVRFEIDIPKERLKGCASGPGSNQRGVEGRGDNEDGRLCVVYSIFHESVVPNLHEVSCWGISSRVKSRTRIQLALDRSTVA